MPFDFDLVIIGGSGIARSIAATAGRLKTRVALVEPNSTLARLQTQIHFQTQIHCHTFQTQAHSVQNGSQWQAGVQASHQFVRLLAENENLHTSIAQLARCGVDVIIGQGRFERTTRRTSQPFALIVNDRVLRSRAYLLATGSLPILPAIEGLDTIDYRTIDHFWQNPWQTQPERLVMIGTDPNGIALAQTLNRMGTRVTLVSQTAQLLPHADQEAVFFFQAFLEAEGIDLYLNTNVTRIQPASAAIELQLETRLSSQFSIPSFHSDSANSNDYRSNKYTTLEPAATRSTTLETDAVLLATDRYPDVLGLNIESIGVQCHTNGVSVNSRLQTTHPRIYACGDVLGGYSLTNVATHEADVALFNALFLSKFFKKRVQYHTLPWAVLTDPPFVQVGLTESQARAAYANVRVFRQTYQPLLSAHLRTMAIGNTAIGNAATGFCKLITLADGEILGAQGIGTNAQEWISIIALAMQQRTKLGTIDPSTFVSPSFSEVIARFVDQWQDDRLLKR
jgi:pyruvate/2-oxoglutarate dehydrogenase complex dihydrolipoamide dehydrogenase (E3) component